MADRIAFIGLALLSILLFTVGIFWKRWDSAERKWRSAVAIKDRALLKQAKAELDGEEEWV